MKTVSTSAEIEAERNASSTTSPAMTTWITRLSGVATCWPATTAKARTKVAMPSRRAQVDQAGGSFGRGAGLEVTARSSVGAGGSRIPAAAADLECQRGRVQDEDRGERRPPGGSGLPQPQRGGGGEGPEERLHGQAVTGPGDGKERHRGLRDEHGGDDAGGPRVAPPGEDHAERRQRPEEAPGQDPRLARGGGEVDP